MLHEGEVAIAQRAIGLRKTDRQRDLSECKQETEREAFERRQLAEHNEAGEGAEEILKSSGLQGGGTRVGAKISHLWAHLDGGRLAATAQ